MSEPIIRRATRADLPAVIALLAQDTAGAHRHVDDAGPPLDPVYEAAFAELDGDANALVVAVELAGRVIGTAQLTFARQLANRGGRVCILESVRISAAERSRGFGATLVRWAIDEARRRGCHRLQLTSHKERTRAHAFYERLGFRRSHEGFRIELA